MPEITLLESDRQGLDEMMAHDPRIFVFGEDVGKRGGVFRVTEGLYDKYGPLRIIDSPLPDEFQPNRATPDGGASLRMPERIAAEAVA